METGADKKSTSKNSRIKKTQKKTTEEGSSRCEFKSAVKYWRIFFRLFMTAACQYGSLNVNLAKKSVTSRKLKTDEAREICHMKWRNKPGPLSLKINRRAERIPPAHTMVRATFCKSTD